MGPRICLCLPGEEGRRTVYQIEARDGYTRGGGFGWLIDTAVVSEVVTSSARGQSELGIWSERQDLNLRFGDDTCSSHDYFTSFLPRNQTHFIYFSKRTFYVSINKTNIRSYTRFT